MEQNKSDQVSSSNLREEYAGSSFGDPRLDSRLMSIVEGLEKRPAESFPTIFPVEAELEGFYRFLSNPTVSFGKILQSHYQASCSRALNSTDVIMIHDTSDMKFHRRKETDLGLLNRSTKGIVRQVGFPIHCSFAVSGIRNPKPLGMVEVHSLRRLTLKKSRKQQRNKRIGDEQKSESYKWIRNIRECRRKLGETINSINVMDREADCYILLATLVNDEERFVIRVAQEKRKTQGEESITTISRVMSEKTVACEREVYLSEKNPAKGRQNLRHPPRSGRKAVLSIKATSLKILRSTYASKEDYPKYLKLNIIHVYETNPPNEEKPVDWKLYTTESIENENDILKIVDIYRARWVIEEFFKALKTGCSYEDRQIESYKTAMNALALMLPIAWQMLLLRHYSREAEPITPILNPIQLQIIMSLRKKFLSEHPTPRELLFAIASLGGHIKNNGDPGWLVLYRGMRELYSIERGVNLNLHY